jgi:hypothetical protein
MSNLSVATWRIWKNSPTDPPDAVIQAGIDAAEEAIRDDLARNIVVAGSATPRRYVADSDDPSLLVIHDCTTVTAVSDNGATVLNTQYQLEPLNGLGDAGTATPYTAIRLLNGVRWSRNGTDALITVTATWGWTALPSRYTEATKILSADIIDQRDIRNGVAGFADYGAVRVRENATVVKLLQRLRRAESWGMA